MKRYFLISLTCLLAFFCLGSLTFAQKTINKDKAADLCRQGVEAIDKGHYDKAVDLLTQASALDPSAVEYPYELAFAWYQNKSYEKSIHILDSLKNLPNATDHVYQLLGNSYDNMKNTDMALKTYQEGLVKFPNSGRLYMETGLAEMEFKKPRDVIVNWESGVRFDPSYANNYYYLAAYYSRTAEKIWAMFYGEIFARLSTYSKRFEENSRNLFDTYNNAIYTAADSSPDIRMTRVVKRKASLNDADTSYETFEMAYQDVLSRAASDVIKPGAKFISIRDLTTIRTNFINIWFGKNLNLKYPNIVFDRHKEMIGSKMFEAYNYWLFQFGSPEEFSSWKKTQPKALDTFIKWQAAHPMAVDSTHNFNRFIYQ